MITWKQRRHLEELEADPARVAALRDTFSRLLEITRQQMELRKQFNELFMGAWNKGCLQQLWDMFLNEDKCRGALWLYYFIRIRGLGDIKFGRTNNIKQRFSSLFTGFPRGADLIACYPDAFEHEAELKIDFADHRLNGEWLEPHHHVLAYLKRIGSDVDHFSDLYIERRHMGPWERPQ